MTTPSSEGFMTPVETPDQRRAAALLAFGISGDMLGYTSVIAEAEDVGRLVELIRATTQLVLQAAAPELRTTDMVDALRQNVALLQAREDALRS